MTILDNIVLDKRKEVDLQKSQVSISDLEQIAFFENPTVSLVERLRLSDSGIIAEHKRQSPSKSVINDQLNVEDVAVGYENAGVFPILPVVWPLQGWVIFVPGSTYPSPISKVSSKSS